jgi:hypothetical protein
MFDSVDAHLDLRQLRQRRHLQNSARTSTLRIGESVEGSEADGSHDLLQ